MENQTISTRGIRLTYKDSYVQAVILPDGRKLAITGSTYGMGAPISALTDIAVAKKIRFEVGFKRLIDLWLCRS